MRVKHTKRYDEISKQKKKSRPKKINYMGAHGIQKEKINVGPYGKNKEMYMHIFEKEGLPEIVAGLSLADTLVNSPLQSKNDNGPDPVFTHLLNSLGPKGLRA